LPVGDRAAGRDEIFHPRQCLEPAIAVVCRYFGGMPVKQTPTATDSLFGTGQADILKLKASMRAQAWNACI
jgi:hypothetical protein